MKIEIRSEDCAVISGYVNAVERRSKVLMRPGAPPFREIVRPGTFKKALDKGNPVALKLNHERTLCDTGSGLELREDNVGLYASATVTDKETVDAARSGKLTGWSFGFCCVHDTWRSDEGGIELRELDDIQLDEVSILTKTPAYIATSVEVRDSVSRPTQGALVLNIHALKASERADILGETVASDTAPLTGKEVTPYMVVALAEELPNGHVNLHKYYKTQFAQGQIGTQQTDTGVTFSTISLNGTYIKNGRVGKMRDIKFDVDPTTEEGSAAIEAWFTNAVPSTC